MIKNYKIFSLRGMKDYINDINSCLKQRNKIAKEIEKLSINMINMKAQVKIN